MLAITTVFLVIVFIAGECYRFGRRVTGRIREIRPIGEDPIGLGGAHLQVVTSAGEITAFVSGCQMCVSRLEVGTMVSLIPGPNGYVMKSPWFFRGRQGSCPRGVEL